VLYFVLQDLHKIRSIYSFSLMWFKDIFFKSIDMTNVCKPDHLV